MNMLCDIISLGIISVQLSIIMKKEIILITYDNEMYENALQKHGFKTTAFQLPYSEEIINHIKNITRVGNIIIEVDEQNIQDLKMHFSNKAVLKKICCLARKLSPQLQEEIKSCGIANVLPTYDTNRLTAYIKSMQLTPDVDQGKILIIEDSLKTQIMLTEIISRFNYDIIFINNFNELQNETNDLHTQFLLLNLGTEKININNLIRKSYAQLQIKRIPILAYKNMEDGIFINELISGLNRLTKYVLSHDELYSFLVELLFKKEIIPLLTKVNKTIELSENNFYSKLTIGQIFQQNVCNIFNSENFLTDDNILQVLNYINAIKNSIVKVDGLRWLKLEPKEEKITCGVGV